MKKIKLLIIFLISIFVFNINVKAASANLTVSSRSIYVGDTFTVNVNMKSAAAWNIHVTSSGPVSGCTINQADATTDAMDTSKTFTATCSATAEGTINITLSGDVTSASDGNAVNISGSASVNVSKKTTTNTTRTTTTTKATTTKTVTTTKSVTNNNQTTKSVTNNNQTTTNKITTTKQKLSNDTNIKSIDVNGRNIEIVQDKDSYDIEVSNSTTKLELNINLLNTKASFTVQGNTDLEVGNNVVNIIVTAEDKTTTRNYTLNIKRKEEGSVLSSNSNAKDIIINNSNFKFDKNIKNYDLKIGNEKELDIKVLTEADLATYKIIGNKDLKNKSVIEIKVTAEDGSYTVYKINIIKSNNNLILYILGGIVLVSVISGIALFLIKKNKNKINNI